MQGRHGRRVPTTVCRGPNAPDPRTRSHMRPSHALYRSRHPYISPSLVPPRAQPPPPPRQRRRAGMRPCTCKMILLEYVRAAWRGHVACDIMWSTPCTCRRAWCVGSSLRSVTVTAAAAPSLPGTRVPSDATRPRARARSRPGPKWENVLYTKTVHAPTDGRLAACRPLLPRPPRQREARRWRRRTRRCSSRRRASSVRIRGCATRRPCGTRTATARCRSRTRSSRSRCAICRVSFGT